MMADEGDYTYEVVHLFIFSLAKWYIFMMTLRQTHTWMTTASLWRTSRRELQDCGGDEPEVQSLRIWELGPGFHSQHLSVTWSPSLLQTSVSSSTQSGLWFPTLTMLWELSEEYKQCKVDPRCRRFSASVSWIKDTKYFSWGWFSK